MIAATDVQLYVLCIEHDERIMYFELHRYIDINKWVLIMFLICHFYFIYSSVFVT